MKREETGTARGVDEWKAKARARREARTSPRGVLWYEEGDPRLLLTSIQIRALPMIARGMPINEIAVLIRRSPRRLRRWIVTRRFQAALQRERTEPSSPTLLLQAGLTDPASASDRFRQEHLSRVGEADEGGLND